MPIWSATSPRRSIRPARAAATRCPRRSEWPTSSHRSVSTTPSTSSPTMTPAATTPRVCGGCCASWGMNPSRCSMVAGRPGWRMGCPWSRGTSRVPGACSPASRAGIASSRAMRWPGPGCSSTAAPPSATGAKWSRSTPWRVTSPARSTGRMARTGTCKASGGHKRSCWPTLSICWAPRRRKMPFSIAVPVFRPASIWWR